MWLTIVGGIASAILSYYTRYDDGKVRDMLKDIAYNLNLALQKLDEIAQQIDQLGQEIAKLPDEVRKIVHSEQIIALNTVIHGALIRFKDLIGGPDNDLFKRQIEALYHDVAKARSELQALSLAGNIEFSPLAATVSPLAMLLELGLLYRLGKQANALRAATAKDFQHWFDFILDPNSVNSVAAFLNEKTATLDKSDKDVSSGLLQVAVANPGTRQAFYCLEHQIGGTMQAPFPFGPRPGETYAEWLGLTWIRFYGATTLNQKPEQGVAVWIVGQNDPKLDIEQYARKGPSDQWYSTKPPYTISVDSYDSRDIQRFQGQDHPSRVRDIENSAKWHDFLANRFPAAKQQLAENNQLRINVKFASDVIAAVKAAKGILAATFTGRIMAVSEAV